MKMLVVSTLLTLVSTAAFAQQRIDLSAGSSVRLNVGQATTVTCEGSSSSSTGTGSCTIEQGYGGTFVLRNAGKPLGTYSNLESALEMAKKMNEAGLCR